MKKYIILILLIFLCFGCKAEYIIKINGDKSVEETIIGLEDEEFYNRYPKSSKKRVINFSTYLVSNYLESLNYDREMITKGIYTGEKESHKFKSLDDYFSKSKAYDQLYKNFDTNINGKIVTISLKNRYPKNGNSVDKYMIDDCKVTIILPFYVKEHNADEYNAVDNSYTWNLNIDDEKEIYIQFDMNKKVIKTDFEKSLPYIIISTVVVILFIIIVINKKTKRRNKF